jgi:hypothetical protein
MPVPVFRRGTHEASNSGEQAMKAFVAAVVVALVLAIGAAFALNWLDLSTANVEQSQGNVRL